LLDGEALDQECNRFIEGMENTSGHGNENSNRKYLESGMRAFSGYLVILPCPLATGPIRLDELHNLESKGINAKIIVTMECDARWQESNYFLITSMGQFREHNGTGRAETRKEIHNH
jgi:hypothetical protein